ncbi:Ribose transport system permease [Sinomonas atrocyanea]|uniref:Ribose transport system permease n=1 Tax=Sinomonas atrocyanea TaxID=37927 RepID=A0A126ZYI9_9MICC|nr:Ribose transport system permease [Sinomonas atrocyanea]GEB64197.1 ribose ABC transporter permease [Sinomonas atrocyanea]GGG57135.1 ribose ABC transporter permease [Sinomonas atrocyanea]
MTSSLPAARLRGPGSLVRKVQTNERLGVIAALVLLVILLTWASPYFLTTGNFVNIGSNIAVIGIVATGSTLVMLGGGIDISIGSTVAVAGIAAGKVLSGGGPWVLAVGAALAVGAIAGLVNGLLVTVFNINPLIATLGTLSVFRGMAFILAGGVPQSAANATFLEIGLGQVLGIPTPVYLMAIIVALAWVALNKTTVGRNIYALGGNADAARLAGIRLDRYRLGLYLASGLLSGVAAVVLTAKLGSAQPLAADGLELDAIAACVLGGIALTGGIGTIGGTLLGVVILGIVNNGLAILSVDSFYQYLARGGVLLVAVALDQYNAKRRDKAAAATIRRREKAGSKEQTVGR